jgi:hypothetical protein
MAGHANTAHNYSLWSDNTHGISAPIYGASVICVTIAIPYVSAPCRSVFDMEQHMQRIITLNRSVSWLFAVGYALIHYAYPHRHGDSSMMEVATVPRVFFMTSCIWMLAHVIVAQRMHGWSRLRFKGLRDVYVFTAWLVQCITTPIFQFPLLAQVKSSWPSPGRRSPFISHSTSGIFVGVRRGPSSGISGAGLGSSSCGWVSGRRRHVVVPTDHTHEVNPTKRQV